METYLGDRTEENGVFWDALDFALKAHADQWRRSGDPYIMHPCSVAEILAEELDIREPEILAAALLHDTVEDVDEITNEVVCEHFGPNVEAIVDGCTKVHKVSGDRQLFKKQVHRKIFSGAAAKPEVMLVKIADRLHNLRTLSSMPRHKRQKIADETLDIYAPLATILGLFNIKRELYNLALAYKFPRQGAKLQVQIRSLREGVEFTEIIDKIKQALNDDGLDSEISLRVKGLWGYYDVRNRILMKEIEIPLEILIILPSRNNCYQALGALNRVYPPVPRTIRDFIANPKPTGYQGLHARAIINGRKYLFKLRTKEMARRAQRGMVREWMANSKMSRRFLGELQEMFDILGSSESVSYRDMIAASGRKEIYTYSPKGDLFCLPVNSIVLDFAFRIHTAIGHGCVGAWISNRKVDSSHVLRDGDVVNIIRSNDPVRFDPAMQMQCQTPKARSELAKAFRARRQEVSRKVGASVLQQEIRRYGMPCEIIEKPGMAEVLAFFKAKNLDELLLMVGEGRVRMRELIQEIHTRLNTGGEILQLPVGVFNRIELTTLDPVVVKTSACCYPSPLDKGLIGLLSIRGLSLHNRKCEQLQKIKFQREDAVEVRWKLQLTKVRVTQCITVKAVARSRIFMLLSVAPGEMQVQHVELAARHGREAGDWRVLFTVPNLFGLRQVLRHFSRAGLEYVFELAR